ncbi:MAG: Mut7-C RNAse domain-containing protein [Proteobacteria bacterium]|nr:Mut7-C RNAse domain-containing protein [Pseudomonadota bacterium]
MKLFCDEMLAGLARWLRAAGHDTALGPAGARDRDLLALAAAEDRIFLTRDRSVTQIKTTAEVWILPAGGLEAEAAALRARGLDWRLAPFTRCPVDNIPLQPAGPEDLLRMPEESRILPGPHRTCPGCRRVYWPGSHVRRMQARLELWASQGGDLGAC